MPYSSTSELPGPVRDKYSEKCQRAYMHAFNSVHEDTGDEGRAAAAGHSAAQDCEEKNKGMDEIQTVMPETRFNIFTGLLKASKSADGKMRLHGVASSTTRDLHGDVMEASALEDMERSANQNLTIFLNHSYDIPEDVAGSVEKAVMKTRGADQDGNPNHDLDMDILINDANDRAVQAWRAIDKGTKLGLSIGAVIPEGGAIRDKKSGALTIRNVNLLETSLVGIPANPRSWVEYAVKSFNSQKDATTVPLGQPTLTLDGSHYKIEGEVDGLKLADTEPEVVIDAAGCPTCGKGKADSDDCADPYHTKDVEPEITDATVTVIQIDTGDESSESDSSSSDDSSSQAEPESGGGDYDAGASPDLVYAGPVSETVQRTLDLLATTTSELIAARAQVSELTVSLGDATRDRDQAKASLDLLVIETAKVLSRLQDAPFARKAIVFEAQQELRAKYAGLYDETFMKTLESQNDRAR